MSGYTKLFSSIVTSTIWGEPDNVRIVWITMLATADRHGVVEGSIPGLATLARQSLDATAAAVKRLHEPDEWSRSKEYDGRRIETIDGGWRILNYPKYRDRLGRQDDELSDSPGAVRARRYRERRRGTESDEALRSVTERDGGVAPYASASAFVVNGPEERQKPVWREEADAAAFLDGVQFGPYERDVLALLRVSQFPASVAAVLRAHVDQRGATAADVGEAVREFLAAGQATFSAAYFAGFVRRVRGRKAQDRETTAIGHHEQRKADESTFADQQAARRQARINDWLVSHSGEEYDVLRREADALVDPKLTRGRGILVTAKMRELLDTRLNEPWTD